MKTEEEIKERRDECRDFLERIDLSIESIRFYQGVIDGLKFVIGSEEKDDQD